MQEELKKLYERREDLIIDLENVEKQIEEINNKKTCDICGKEFCLKIGNAVGGVDFTDSVFEIYDYVYSTNVNYACVDCINRKMSALIEE